MHLWGDSDMGEQQEHSVPEALYFTAESGR